MVLRCKFCLDKLRKLRGLDNSWEVVHLSDWASLISDEIIYEFVTDSETDWVALLGRCHDAYISLEHAYEATM